MSAVVAEIKTVRRISENPPVYLGKCFEVVKVALKPFLGWIEEARTLERIRHPNVVKLYGTQKSFLVFQYIPWRTLQQVLNDVRVALPWKQRLAMGRKISEARKYLIGQKFYLWDLQSSNIFVSEKLEVKLGGFCGSGVSDQRSLVSLGGVFLDFATRGLSGEERLMSRRKSLPYCPVDYARFIAGCFGAREGCISLDLVEKRALSAMEEGEEKLPAALSAYSNKLYRIAAKGFQWAASACLPDGQFFYGLCLWGGQGCQQDKARGTAFLKLALGQGHKGAQVKLGLIYQAGDGVRTDEKLGATLYSLSAIQGNREAQGRLAECYDRGRGVAEDQRECLHWYIQLADGGTIVAQYLVGLAFEVGDVLPKDDLLAWHYHSLAAKQKHGEAVKAARRLHPKLSKIKLAQRFFLQGVRYQKGDGVKQDDRLAAACHRIASNIGLVEATTNLGLMYIHGRGVPKDMKRGVRYLQVSAKMKDAPAFHNLGACYQHGRGIPEDPVKAFHHYKTAADLGLAAAQYETGYCYEHAQGVDYDLEKALVYYTKAKDQKHAKAELVYFRLMARKGDAHSQFKLGCYYEKGPGVPEQFRLRLAIKFYKLAAAQGILGAKKRLKELGV